MEYQNVIYEEWAALIRGVPTEYHKRFADRVVACIGNWVPEDHLGDVLSDMRYHRRQIHEIYEAEFNRDRYDKPYLDMVKQWHRQETPSTLNTS